MNQKYLFHLLAGFFFFLTTCFSVMAGDWKKEFKKELPLLGHRNWIVIVDMAYPLQNRSGIKTMYTGETYMDVLSTVYSEIKGSAHIKPIIYQDKELSFMSDAEVAGIDDLKKEMTEMIGEEVIRLPHDDLIARLDEVGQTFTVVILKTNLMLPYTSTFIELDCGYWNDEKQGTLLEKMKNRDL